MQASVADLLPFATAALLGSVIGLERQWHQGMAGLRTNALVATAASAFVHLPVAAMATDLHPAGLAGSVISGIGFLGAGVILREGTNVRGLNTAATLWGSAAVGVYAGADLAVAACLLTAVILSINVLLRPVITQLNRLGAHFSAGSRTNFHASVECLAADHVAIRTYIIEHGRKLALHLRSMRTEAISERPEALRLQFEVTGFGRVDQTVEQLLVSLGSFSTVYSFAWTRIDAIDGDVTQHPDS